MFMVLFRFFSVFFSIEKQLLLTFISFLYNVNGNKYILTFSGSFLIFEVAMKIYAVKKGRVPGVYRNWDETKKQVDGFSGAEYKSFENITDAIDYLGWQEKSHEETINRKDDTLENAIEKIKHNSKKPVKATKNKKTKIRVGAKVASSPNEIMLNMVGSCFRSCLWFFSASSAYFLVLKNNFCSPSFLFYIM